MGHGASDAHGAHDSAGSHWDDAYHAADGYPFFVTGLEVDLRIDHRNGSDIAVALKANTEEVDEDKLLVMAIHDLTYKAGLEKGHGRNMSDSGRHLREAEDMAGADQGNNYPRRGQEGNTQSAVEEEFDERRQKENFGVDRQGAYHVDQGVLNNDGHRKQAAMDLSGIDHTGRIEAA